MDLQAGDIAVLSSFMLFAIFMLVGTFVQYTSLFNKDTEAKPANDEELVDSKTPLGLFFLSFAVPRNMKKLFLGKGEAYPNLKVLNGTRNLSIGYMIIGHTFVFQAFMPLSPETDFFAVLKQWPITIINGGFFSVDVFFFLSGFLSAFVLVQNLLPRGGRVNFLILYFHRFLRLILPVIAITMFTATLLRFLGDGPLWPQWIAPLIKTCESSWWSNLLFI